MALFNDTGSFAHVGCKAVSRAHDLQLAALGAFVLFRHYVGEYEELGHASLNDALERLFRSALVREMSRVEAILINGEGTIHHGYGSHLLTILAGAQALGKPTYLFNAVLQDVPESFLPVLRKLDDLTVRDASSLRYVLANRIPARLVADSILMADFAAGTDPRFAGKIVVTDCVENRRDVARELKRALAHYGDSAVYFPLEGDTAGNWRDAVKTLSGAKAIVTGRHHGLYLALMAQVPFIALPSNSWKIEGTLAAIDGSGFLWTDGDDLISMVDAACNEPGRYEAAFAHPFLRSAGAMLDVFARDFGLQVGGDVFRHSAMSEEEVTRYRRAASYIKPGDRVLVISPHPEGGDIVRWLSPASEVQTADRQVHEVRRSETTRSADEHGDDSRATAFSASCAFGSGSFETIVAIPIPVAQANHPDLLREFLRLLTPGGRVILGPAGAGDNNDLPGLASTPPCAQDVEALCLTISECFILEDACCGCGARREATETSGRQRFGAASMKRCMACANSSECHEGSLVTAMKSPLAANPGYEERVYPNVASARHPSGCYADSFDNPWLMHAMVNCEYRIRNPEALNRLVEQVLRTARPDSNDHAAALCVKAYRVLAAIDGHGDDAHSVLRMIETFAGTPCSGPMGLRWNVSLLFAKGKLLQALDRLEDAKRAFIACTNFDIENFGIHLATKTTEAFYLAGRIAYIQGRREEARGHWRRGIEYGEVLTHASLDDILIDRERPNLFNHGDGIREYTVAWDNVARCANGIHLTNSDRPLDFFALDNCHQSEYAAVTSDLACARQALTERTDMLERLSADLRQCTAELIDGRETLIERTELLEDAGRDLRQRTAELVDTRRTLTERTEMLERLVPDLQQRTEDLIETRRTLVERTALLERVSLELRQREEMLAAVERDLQQQSAALSNARQTLVERTDTLARMDADLQKCKADLARLKSLWFFRLFSRKSV